MTSKTAPSTRFNLAWAYKTTEFFRENPLFYYPVEAAAWLNTAEKVAALANRVRTNWLQASEDAAACEARLRSIANPVVQRLTDLMVFSASAKVGYMLEVPHSMLPTTEDSYSLCDMLAKAHQVAGFPRETLSPEERRRRGIRCSIPFEDERGVKIWRDIYTDWLKKDMETASKQMALAWIPMKGILRRALKLQHDMTALADSLYEKLFVPFVPTLKDNLHDLVFRGLWGADAHNQVIFNRIIKVFVGDMGWTSQAQEARGQVDWLRDQFRFVSDNRTRQGLLEIVDVAIQFGGGLAS